MEVAAPVVRRSSEAVSQRSNRIHGFDPAFSARRKSPIQHVKGGPGACEGGWTAAALTLQKAAI